MTTTSSSDSGSEHCRRKLAEFRQRLGERRRYERRMARARLLLFLIGVGLLFLLASDRLPTPLSYGLLAACIVAFLVAARKQERAAEERKQARRLMQWYERGKARQERDWKKLPRRPLDVPPSLRQLATDLDLFGSGSLFQLIDEAQTERGRRHLANWLLEPAPPDEAQRRYQALVCLAGDRDFREALYDRASSLSLSLADPEAFLSWARGIPWYERRRWLRRFVPVSTLLMAVSTLTWLLTHFPLLGLLSLALFLLHIVIVMGWGSGIYTTFNRVQSRHREVARYRELFDLLDEAARRHAAVEQWLTRDEGCSFRTSRRAWKQLERIMALCALRQSGLLSIVHALLQPMLLWDFHVMRLLDQWQRRHGEEVVGWFDELAALEALACLSVLGDDHPDWVAPRFDPRTPRWEGTDVGHPLLRDEVRVTNDVAVGPPGTVLLVTGSNMSGKSTLLRSIGVNTVLAQAGAPVCASSLKLPPVTIATSMRIRDSLEEGVSFYLAELKRLKEIVDLAANGARRDGRHLLYLLDEILQGTNSKERHIAVAHVVAHLLKQEAIGAISTHDLELASSPLLADAVRPVHFRESFHEGPEGREMIFDYRLRDGVATTTNALTLLEMVGLAKDRLDD